MSTTRTDANSAAADMFANATVEDVQTAYVSTYVQVGRFTPREAREVRRWAVMAMAERVGYQAASDFVEACHAC